MAMTSSTGSIGQALQRMTLRDMLVVPETTDLFLTNLTQYTQADPARGEQMALEARESLAMAYGYDDDRDSDTRKPFVYNDGVAVIPIHGTLINRFNSSWGFVTGYNFIRRQMNAALDDDDVVLIVFDVDSPGGEASGCFELAREIEASRRVKPSLAMVDSLAASGGMALAGSATQMVAIPSARIGSIGVYRMHVSYQKQLENEGIKITFATAGEHKIDGNPYQDLPQAVLDEWKESAGRTWDDFISLVADTRDMGEAEVKATQARVYRADEALAKGLINAVKTPTEAVAAFLAELAEDSPSNTEEEDDMADAPKGGKEVTSGLSEADLTKIGAMISTALAPLAQANRASTITALGTAQGKPKLAATLAADESISLETAKSILNAAAVEGPAPKGKGKAKVAAVEEPGDDDDDDAESDDGEGDDDADADADDDDDDAESAAEIARAKRKGGGKAKAKGGRSRDNVNHLDNAMGRSRQPNVGAGDDGEGDDGDDPAAQAAAILGDHARVAGASWSANGMKKAKKAA
jgi:signal peptide peptidase SppA